MFEYIKGTLEDQTADYAVIDNNGIGFRVMVSLNTLTELPKLHEELCLLLFPVYREDDITLYGFATSEERDMFKTLTGITGIGPKAAMGLLSQFTGDDLIRHIINGDAKAIARAPGIGKKSAERIILELKDKFKDYVPADEGAGNRGATESLRTMDNRFNEAINGLLGLGFPYAQASQLVESVMTDEMPIEEILKKALMAASAGR